MKYIVSCLAVLGFFAVTAFPAFAMDLSTARQKGLVGERLDGYVGVVAANPEATDLASSVNARRKEEYARISAQNGQPVSVVAKVAAEEVINSLPSGSLYQSPDGGWKRK